MPTDHRCLTWTTGLWVCSNWALLPLLCLVACVVTLLARNTICKHWDSFENGLKSDQWYSATMKSYCSLAVSEVLSNFRLFHVITIISHVWLINVRKNKSQYIMYKLSTNDIVGFLVLILAFVFLLLLLFCFSFFVFVFLGYLYCN